MAVRKVKKTAALLAVACLVGTGAFAGCSDSDDGEAQTPAGSTTVANTALQTDSNGKTTSAPAATEATTEATTEAGGDGGGAKGDAAEGKTAFAANPCAGCHPNAGQDAGVGPKLAGAGLDEALIRDRIQNGKGAMPAGLVSGETEDNIVAYVLSIQ